MSSPPLKSALERFLSFSFFEHQDEVQEINKLIPELIKEVRPDQLIDIPSCRQPHSLLHILALFCEVDYELLFSSSNTELSIDCNISTQSGRLPLHDACRNVNKKAVVLLLTHGAQVNPTNVMVPSPIMQLCYRAITDDTVEILKLLIRHGANVNFEWNEGGHNSLTQSVLLFSVWRHPPWNEVLKETKFSLFLKELINAGANVNWICEGNYNALHMACYYRDMESAKVLIENGCDYNLRNDRGSLPIDRIGNEVLENEFLEIIELIKCR